MTDSSHNLRGIKPRGSGKVMQGDLVRPSGGSTQSGAQSTSSGPDVVLDLGFQKDDPSIPVIATPEQMFGRHCAVIGATGGGKSWTLARIMEECARYRSKVILFDATGEFYTLSRGVRHVHIGFDPDPPEGSKAVSVPYYHLRESDLFSIFQPSGPSQGPKLRAAMKSLKLARLAPTIAPDGTILKAHRPKHDFEELCAIHVADLESPYALFEISNLVRQIQHECIDPFRSSVEPMIWGGTNTQELSNTNSLCSRVQDITTLPHLSCLFSPGDLPSIFDEIHTFLRDPVTRILRISLKYLPFDYGTRETVANALARHLLELAREDTFRRQPLVVIVDEAHQFLNEHLEKKVADGTTLDAFGLIAKEGRKYALTIVISTQRPRDIPEAVLSQMGTIMVHRLINHYDLTVVERAAGAMSRDLMIQVPTMTSGHALLVGVDFSTPRIVKVNAPDCPPFSKSADFQKAWK